MLRQTLRKTAKNLIAPVAATALAVFGAAACSQSERTGSPSSVVTSVIPEPATKGSPALLRLMTSQQYLNTIAYVFGDDVKPPANFAPMQRTDGLLQSGQAKAGVTETQLEAFQKAASAVATDAVEEGRRNFIFPCKPADEDAADDACTRQIVSKFGRLLFRRPVTPAEQAQFTAQASEAAGRLKSYYGGLGVALEAMLISPETLFISEESEQDPAQPGARRLNAYSLASRLSFFLWNAAPDDELLTAAERGELHTQKGRERAIDRMIASPRLEFGVRSFFDDMLALDEASNVSKDATIYPYFTPVTVVDAREQTLRTIVDQLVFKKGDYRDLYTTRKTFISPGLAALYEIPAPPNWIPYEFPPNSPRVGLVSQISFLASHSHPGRSSPTLRGKALRELILCQPVPDPPANVDFSALENPKAVHRTQRDRVNDHLDNPVCAGCHRITDPIGLSLENFDGAGRYRPTEGGAEIDSSGSLDGKAFPVGSGLGQALHDHPGLSSCLVKRAYAYGTGGVTSPGDAEILKYLNARFAADGYRLAGLLRAITLSRTFSQVRETVPATLVNAASAPAPSSN